jgi:ABC-type multidrug transport system fused ATPase/permease subunit
MPLLDLMFTMLVFFIWIAWIWLVISVFIDIFRSDDLSGWGKAGWTIGVLIVPLFGVLIYLIARGGKMQQRAVDQAMARDQATREYIRSTAGASGDGVSDEIAKLAELRDKGVLTDEEFQAQKAKLLV